MTMLKKSILFLIAFLVLFFHTPIAEPHEVGFSPPPNARAMASSQYDALVEKLNRQIGPQDAAMLIDPDGNLLFEKHQKKPLIPASTLKVLTALFAIDLLGENFRFVTEFYRDDAGNLKIKGYGDPLLISEQVEMICRHLASLIPSFNDLLLDTGFFEKPLVIPGISDSLQPYDAPNGALCVNFNTVLFKQNKNGTYSSGESQTPLLPFVRNRVESSKQRRGRILLSAKAEECTLYAGHLFLHFMKKHGIKSGDVIRTGAVDRHKDHLLYRHLSQNDLKTTIQMMLKSSNNYMANQIFIVAATQRFQGPGSLAKATRAMGDYISRRIQKKGITVVEGSGISRQNRITAQNMMKILNRFEPYHELMRKEGAISSKTGTLKDIRARVGYMTKDNNRRYKFVIMINTPGKSEMPILRNFLKLANL